MSDSRRIVERTLRARRLTALALVLLFAPPLWVASPAAASPGNGWASPIDLIPSTSNAYYNDLAADRSGNAFVVWSEYTGSDNPIMLRRFVAGAGWQASERLSEGDGYYVSITTSAIGDAFAAWSSWNGSGYNISFRRYTADWGWSSQRNFTGLLGDTYYLDTAMDGAGNAYILAQTWNGSTYVNYGMRVSSALGLQGPTRLSSANLTNGSYYGKVAAGRAAGAFFVWAEYNGSSLHIWAARNTGGGFTSSQPIDDRTEWAEYPSVGVDDFGRAIVVYDQYIGSARLRWVQWNGVWTLPEDLSGSYYGWAPDLRVTPSGAATVGFITYSSPDTFPAVARYYPTDGVWQAPTRGPENLTSGYANPVIAADAGGNPVIVWGRLISGNYPLRAAQVSGTSWLSRTWLQEDSSAASDQTQPHVEFVGSGEVLAVWSQWDGARWLVRANLFRPADATPPWVRIETPRTGDVFGSPSITVTGWADPSASVWVNGAAATVGADGYFVATVPAGEGWTWLVATARDPAGNYGYSNGRLAFYQNPTHSRDAERASAGIAGPQVTSPMDELNYWGAWWPQVLTAPDGVAYATWYEWVYPSNQHYVSRYTPGVGWGLPIHLAGEEGNLYGAPQMAMDAGGNLTVMWATADLNGRWNHVWAFHYMAAGWWGGPYRVDTGQRYAYWPDVAASPEGRTLMVWQQREETNYTYDIKARWFDPGSFSWTADQVIEGINNTTEGPRVSFDGLGNAYAVVRVWNTTQPTDLALLRYLPGTGWDNGTILTGTSNPASFAAIDTDRSGNSTLAWLRYINNSYFQLYTGRFWADQTWSGSRMLWNDSWSWDPEVMAVDNGYALVAETATVNGTPDALVAVIAPGQVSANMTRMDNTTGWGGGPKVSKGYADGTVKAHWDEYENNVWRANMRSYDFTTGNWSANRRLVTEDRGGNIPDLAPMPDGGFIGVWLEFNASMGSNQVVGRRFAPEDVTPPTLTVTTPANGTTVNTSTVRVAGSAEPGRPVLINGVSVWVEANGSFAVDIALVNGTNVVRASSWDPYGNTVWVNRTVIFDNPERRRIEQLETANAALQAALNATNASLTAALAAQNASLLGQIAGLNSSLVAQLAAQNSSILGAIASLNASLLAKLAAQDASLTQLIAETNASLLADLAAQNSALTQLIADTNVSLLADLAAQNDALLQEIAATNATLFGQLLAQNASLTQALANVNASLLASLAAQNNSLASLIGATNLSLLASLASQNASLTASLASLNTSLLASLAAQNDALLTQIAMTNASLLNELARTNSTLWARLTAENGALWTSLNASRAEQQAADAGISNNVNDTNTNLGNTQNDVSTAQQAAQSATTMALLGLLIGTVGIGVAAFAIMTGRKGGRPPPELAGPPPPAEEVHAQVEVQNSGGTGKS